MPLANYTTRVSVSQSANEIMDMLRAANAIQVLTDYDNGVIKGLSFVISTPNGELPFRMPINTDAVVKVLTRQMRGRPPKPGHAERVAWRIVRDWLRYQLALLETEMVQLEEIFLPYLRLNADETLYERMLDGGFSDMLALGPGNPQ